MKISSFKLTSVPSKLWRCQHSAIALSLSHIFFFFERFLTFYFTPLFGVSSPFLIDPLHYLLKHPYKIPRKPRNYIKTRTKTKQTLWAKPATLINKHPLYPFLSLFLLPLCFWGFLNLSLFSISLSKSSSNFMLGTLDV